MKLINVSSLEIEEYFDDKIPEYAILSHTWGQEEVSFREWTMLAQTLKPAHGPHSNFEAALQYLLGMSSFEDIQKRSGYAKIIACCEQAKRDGLRYVWADTCCIDKTSSAELSEAINSMFQWYKSSKICYAYLSDVRIDAVEGESHSAIRNSRWFLRGWTLQEFLAPHKLAFFDSQWNFISFKKDLVTLLSSITGIGSSYIDGTDDIQKASVAQRMSWASRRQTTRKEDIAYCLIGIFDVNIPLLYGEGDKAFLRLQEEIVRQSEDHSYLAWGFQMSFNRDFDGLFARSPADFRGCAGVLHEPQQCSGEITQMSNKGLQVRLLLWVDTRVWSEIAAYAILRCCGPKGIWLALPIDRDSVLDNWKFQNGAEVSRLPGGAPVAVVAGQEWRAGWSQEEVTVVMKRTPSEKFYDTQSSGDVKILSIHQEISPFRILEVFPPVIWVPSRGTYTVSYANRRFFMKLSPIHTAYSGTEYAILVIDFKYRTRENGWMVHGIQPRVIPADEIPEKPEGSLSLLETLLSNSIFFNEPLTDFCNEANVHGYKVSVEVQDGDPWVIKILTFSRTSKNIDDGMVKT